MQSQLSCHRRTWPRARLPLAGIASQPTVFFVIFVFFVDKAVALDVFAGIAPQHPRFVYDRQILNEARAYDSGSAASRIEGGHTIQGAPDLEFRTRTNSSGRVSRSGSCTPRKIVRAVTRLIDNLSPVPSQFIHSWFILQPANL